MSKIKLKLTAEETETFYTYLSEVMEHVVNPGSLPLHIIMLNVMRVVEKLHTKQLMREALNLKLAEEQALALQYVMAVYVVPSHWMYTANVVRIVQQQLPQIVNPNAYSSQANLPGIQIIGNEKND